MTVETVCVGCGVLFKVPPSRAKKGARFHNLRCFGKWKARSPEERYWAHVVPNAEGCWVWKGDSHDNGYGRLWLSDRPRRFVYAHRKSWEIHNGPIPDDRDVLHHCDNPPCSRPDHLFLGDQLTNNGDRDAKGVQHGSRHANAKMTEASVLRYRALYATGAISLRQLARLAGVQFSTMREAVQNDTWKRASSVRRP
ncbi:MAG: hypothetical protein NVSMB2_25440 [Chloroflexota bacterium]